MRSATRTTTQLQPAVLAIVASVAMTACASGPDAVGSEADGPEFAVGDCVTLEQREDDFDIVEANCEDVDDTDTERTSEGVLLGIYRVVDVLERTDECALDGSPGDIGLDREADNTLYCLSPGSEA